MFGSPTVSAGWSWTEVRNSITISFTARLSERIYDAGEEGREEASWYSSPVQRRQEQDVPPLEMAGSRCIPMIPRSTERGRVKSIMRCRLYVTACDMD